MCNVSRVIIIITIIVSIRNLVALDPEKCKQKPKEKHCLIEWSARGRWPHEIRFVFDWATRRCFQIRWSRHCPAVGSTPIINNFSSEEDCLQHCSGWA